MTADIARTRVGINAIANERRRQIEKLGWTPEHDDDHPASTFAQMILARTAVLLRPFPDEDEGEPDIDLYVEIGAIAAAAVDLLARRYVFGKKVRPDA